MGEENKNYIEEFVKRFCVQKSRLFFFLSACFSALFSIVYLASGKPGGIMVVYSLCLLLASAANIIFSLDIDKKIKYASDILLIGIALALLGTVLRTVQLGIIFSWKYYIAYFIFAFTLILLLIRYAKVLKKEKGLLALLFLLAAYCIFEIIKISTNPYFYGIFSSLYFRFSEIFLFVAYGILITSDKNNLDDFKASLGKYTAQIPSLKIMTLLFCFIAILSLAIGAMTHFSNAKKTKTVTTTTITMEQAPVENKVNKASGTVKSNTADSNAGTDVSESTTTLTPQPENTSITIGQTVSIDAYDFTLNKVEFSHKVVPDNPPSYYTYYDAPANEVYIYLNASIKNKQKQSLECDEIYSVTADYNNGFTYRGSMIANDTDGDFTYANITSVEPLQTRGVHCLISCPDEVESSTEPLFLTITMKDGSKYKYTIR